MPCNVQKAQDRSVEGEQLSCKVPIVCIQLYIYIIQLNIEVSSFTCSISINQPVSFFVQCMYMYMYT